MQITKKDLNNLKYYIDERERLLKEVDNYLSMLSDGYRSQDFTDGIPSKGKKMHEDTTLKIIWRNARIQKEIQKRVKRVEVIIIKLYKIIDKIDNQELKAIVELRAIKGLTWEQIGEEVHLERTTVAKKYANFINN